MMFLYNDDSFLFNNNLLMLFVPFLGLFLYEGNLGTILLLLSKIGIELRELILFQSTRRPLVLDSDCV